MKISLGAGEEPELEKDWVNVDLVELPNIQVIHNLMKFPYPFENESADFIKAKDLIEHLAGYAADGRPILIAFIEECYRILKTGGTLWIQTPSWEADFLWIDPTHVRGFDKRSFDFFDPETDFGKATGFYSKAKFKVEAKELENKNLQFNLIKI
jgi:SAM-dependent methyltransferase